MEDLEAGGVGQEQLGAAVAHNVRRLVGQEPRADWRVREPGAVDGPEHFEEVGGAGQLEGDMVTGTEAGGMQRPGGAVGCLVELPIRHDVTTVGHDHRRFIRRQRRNPAWVHGPSLSWLNLAVCERTGRPARARLAPPLTLVQTVQDSYAVVRNNDAWQRRCRDQARKVKERQLAFSLPRTPGSEVGLGRLALDPYGQLCWRVLDRELRSLCGWL